MSEAELDNYPSTDSDPIATMREWVDRIKQEAGERPPNQIVMHRGVILEMAHWFAAAIKRAEKFLRKPLLSGRYEKRQRQRLTGKARRALEKRRFYLERLPMYREEFESWNGIAGDDQPEVQAVDLNGKQVPG